jgi:GTP diphosphokinase / guanosine-3',5'-bis(diphosphate) 3'-diphosphatase
MPQLIALDKLLEAVIFATRKHQGQVRKDLRQSPYVTHPVSVARIIWQIADVEETNTLLAAVLHDTIEDTDTTADEVRELFGDEVLSIILEVTDNKGLAKLERKRMQIVHAPDLSQPAKIIKLADKLINCQDILHHPPLDWSLERRQNYIQWAADVIARIRGTNAALELAFDMMLTEAEEKLNFKVKSIESVNNRPWAPTPPNSLAD